MFWYIIFIFILIFVYYQIYLPHQHWKIKKVPYMKPFPIMGNMKDFLVGRRTGLETLIDIYNDIDARCFGTYMFLQPLLLIKDPNLIKQMFIKDFDNFTDRHYTAMSEETEHLFGKCIFFLRGQKWKDMRSTLSPAFTSSKMRLMTNLIAECSKNFIDYLEQELGDKNMINLYANELTSRYTTDVIGSCAFGLNCNSFKDRDNEFYKIGGRVQHLIKGHGIKFLGYLLCPNLMKHFKIQLFQDYENNYFRHLVNSTMEYRIKEGIVRLDMIHQLMEAKLGKLKYEESVNTDGFAAAEEGEIGKKSGKTEFSGDELVAQTMIFFAAGFDTNATLLAFMFYELATNEDVQNKLRKEIEETLEECKGDLSYESVTKMKYLDMVICESLRMWPPALAIDRKCTKTYTIQPENVTLEKDSVIWIPIYAIHMDPKYWPNPDKYDPERFSDENKKNIVPFTFIPFGVGPRNCIGSRLALLAVKILIVNLLSKFEFVVSKETEIPIQFPKNHFGMVTKNGIRVGLKKKL